jgi:hypothetical protein
MKHTEEQILTKGKEVLKDLYGNFYREEEVQKVLFDPNEELLRGGTGFIAAWTVVIIEPVSDSLIFLTISDQTGEPIYIQSKHLVREIMKDVNGKYINFN